MDNLSGDDCAMEEVSLAGDTHSRGDIALRILIGENNSDLAMTLNLLLDAEPDMHCVSTASSGKAVLQAVEQHAPNAFILDLSLDDGSSMPLLSILRQRLPAAAIVVFTGHKNELLNEQCMRAGANCVVVKTGEFEELTAALRNAARMRWAPPGAKRADG
jgi:DNA-binding NarL/FixJ family response regulator